MTTRKSYTEGNFSFTKSVSTGYLIRLSAWKIRCLLMNADYPSVGIIEVSGSHDDQLIFSSSEYYTPFYKEKGEGRRKCEGEVERQNIGEEEGLRKRVVRIRVSVTSKPYFFLCIRLDFVPSP